MKIVNPFEPGKKQYYGRYLKPSFRYQSTKSIVVPAGANNPALFIIGGVAMQRTQSLECNLTINGPGGLLTGSLAASSVYYLYAITFRDDIALIADTSDPSVGLTGYDDWTYLGAFVTLGSGNICSFVSSNGFYSTADNFMIGTSTSSTSFVSHSLSPYPSTINRHYGEALVISGTATSAACVVTGNSNGTVAIETYLQASGVVATGFGFIPALDGKNIWIKTTNAANTVRYDPYGWIEDPSEYL